GQRRQQRNQHCVPCRLAHGAVRSPLPPCQTRGRADRDDPPEGQLLKTRREREDRERESGGQEAARCPHSSGARWPPRARTVATTATAWTRTMTRMSTAVSRPEDVPKYRTGAASARGAALAMTTSARSRAVVPRRVKRPTTPTTRSDAASMRNELNVGPGSTTEPPGAMPARRPRSSGRTRRP